MNNLYVSLWDDRAALSKKRKLEQEYIYQAEEKMSQVEVVQGDDGTILGLREAPGLEPMFPSTEELFDFVDDPVKYRQIQQLHDDCLQKADEKVAVARQALELIEAKVQRLDHDLSAMETLLQVCDTTNKINIILYNNRGSSTLSLCTPAGNGRISIRRGGETQRHGSVSSYAWFGMDLSEGLKS